MVIDLTINLVPFGGSVIAGYAMGFVIKKVIKWILIAVGFLVGIFFIILQLMQTHGYIGSVNWDKLGNDTLVQVQHFANVDLSGHGIFYTLGIPVTSGLGIGLLAGFVRTH